MTTHELYNAVINNLDYKNEIHPIQKAMLEESCEHALKKNYENKESLIQSVITGFLILNPVFQGLVNDLLENYDEVNVNYRGVKQSITKDSNLLKS